MSKAADETREVKTLGDILDAIMEKALNEAVDDLIKARQARGDVDAPSDLQEERT